MKGGSLDETGTPWIRSCEDEAMPMPRVEEAAKSKAGANNAPVVGQARARTRLAKQKEIENPREKKPILTHPPPVLPHHHPPGVEVVKIVTEETLRDDILDLVHKHSGRELEEKVLDLFENDTYRASQERMKQIVDNYATPKNEGISSTNDSGGIAIDIGLEAEEAGQESGTEGLPTTGLQRTNRLPTNNTRPGAYMAAPGTALQRNTTPGYQFLGVATGPGEDGSSELIVPPNPVGRLQLDDPIAGELAEVEESSENGNHNSGFLVLAAKPLGFLSKWQKPILAVAGLAILAAIAVGITCGATDYCAAGNDPLHVNITEAPSSTPTGSPTMAPTGNILGFHLLPPSTIRALQDPQSNQSRAYQWILDDPNRFQYTSNRLLQRFALATLSYTMTDGQPENNVISYDSNECDWWSHSNSTIVNEIYPEYPGKPCSDDNEYQYLIPSDKTMMGEVPPELGLLSALRIVDLSKQEVLGDVPSEVGSLTLLNKFRLSHQPGLGRTIPTEFGMMSSLEELRMAECNLEGPIPSQLGQLDYLRIIDIEKNLIVGSIPSQIGLLGYLDEFWVAENNLNSSIPTEISGLTSIRMFHASHNDLTGHFPSEFGSLPKLEELHLEWSLLTSTLPSEIGLSPRLTVLNFDNVKDLNGTIPTQVGMISTLQVVMGHDAKLGGTIPSEVGLLSNLIRFRLPNCKLFGRIPSELGQLKKLEWFQFGDNLLRSSLPTEIGNMDSLVELRLSGSTITGTIPSEVGNMKALEAIYLPHAFFTGTLPTEIGRLSNTLIRIGVWGNMLSGSIPSELGLIAMDDFNVEANLMTGWIPSELGMWQHHNRFIIGRENSFTGPIPSEFGLLKNSKEIKFSENQLSGVVPTELGLLKTRDSPDARLNKFEFARNGNMTGYFFGDICDLAEIHFDCSPQLCGCWCACPPGNENASIPYYSLP